MQRFELKGLKVEKSDAQQARRRVEIRTARAEGKLKEYTQYRDKFHTLEPKAVERDLRAARSKLCESSFLQESVAASSLAPSVNP